MTDDRNELIERIVDSDTRRSFMTKGAALSGVAALGLGGTGSVAAQDGGGQDGPQALMFVSDFHPGGIFRIESGAMDEPPFFTNEPFGNYNPHVIEYRNTNDEAVIFVPNDAQISQGDVYAMDNQFQMPQQNQVMAGVVRVSFSDINVQQFDSDFGFEIADDDFDILDEGGGKALVRWDNYSPGAFFRVVSGVVQPEPQENVEGSDIFSEYNTRFGRFLGMNQNFLFYPAHEAEVTWGDVYRMTEEFDITDPEGGLTTIDFEKVDERGLEDDFRI